MSFYLRNIVFTCTLMSLCVPALCFCCDANSDDVTKLAIIRYNNFTLSPETRQFRGKFWHDVNQIEIGLKFHVKNELTRTNQDIKTSTTSLLANRLMFDDGKEDYIQGEDEVYMAHKINLSQKISTLSAVKIKQEKMFRHANVIKQTLNDLFYMITLNPDFFIIQTGNSEFSDNGVNDQVYLSAKFNKLIKRHNKNQLNGINVPYFTQNLTNVMNFLKVTADCARGKREPDDEAPLFSLPQKSSQQMVIFYQKLITQIGSFQQEIRDAQAMKKNKPFFGCF